MVFWSWKEQMAGLSACAWSSARRATLPTWSPTPLEYQPILRATCVAAPIWRTLCCFVIVVIVATTSTVCSRHWSTCPLVHGAAHNASSFLEVLIFFCFFFGYAFEIWSVDMPDVLHLGGGGGGGVFGSYPYDLSLTRHVSSHTLTALSGGLTLLV